jgi:tetratricopeptide (TPR) repeat protein
LGHTQKAQHALLRASPDNNDWKVLSGLGVAHAGTGQHAKAQDYFNRALVLSPNNPTVLNNLALSYILDKKVDKGRDLLQQASVASSAAGSEKPQIARNLELAMALSGGTRSKPPAPEKLPSTAPGTTAVAGATKPVASAKTVTPVTPVAQPAAAAPAKPASVAPAVPDSPAPVVPALTSVGPVAQRATPPAPAADPAKAMPSATYLPTAANLDPSGRAPQPEAKSGPVEKASLEPVSPSIINGGLMNFGRAMAGH